MDILVYDAAGYAFGFFCAYPMNALLIKLGVKKGM